MSREDVPNLREIPIYKCCANCAHYNDKMYDCRHHCHEFEVGGYPFEWLCDDFKWNPLINFGVKNE